jgi:P63C domain
MKKDQSKVAGGLARATSLDADKRKEIAKKAAIARWGDRPPQATHKGSFQKDFGIEAECYVLNDERKTAVISQRGMAEAIGLSVRGDRLQRFTMGKAIAQYIGSELREKLDKPIIFQQLSAAQKSAFGTLHGYDVTILIDLCNAILQAVANGVKVTEGVAKQAQIILNASAKAGIEGLVYALAGYDRTKEEVIAAYKLYVIEEAREYEREFSPELYAEWYRLYNLPKYERGRPWEFRYLTIDHIYHPLAKSNGKVFALAKSSKEANGTSNSKIHQFLSEIGVKALRTQVGKILGIATVSETREEYEKYIREKIYGQKELPFV